VRTLTELKVEDRSNIYNYLIILSLEFSAVSFQFSSWSCCAVDRSTHASVFGIEIAPDTLILFITLLVMGFERIADAMER
jgi:uncharacterized membrane protein